MKIAITADNHLTSRSKHPERFQVLESILNHCGLSGVTLLIIAGDLFDQSFPNYAEFEQLYQKFCPPDLRVIVIPGNHDRKLDSKSLVGEGLQVFAEPVLLPLHGSWKILLVPYQKDQTMGAAIAPFHKDIKNHPWILIGHGDWSASLKETNPYEPGFYMPLTGTDLEEFQPELVFLGHIHKPIADGIVHYPGSPCPIDQTETGLRRFLLFDTNSGEISSQLTDSPLLYFNERFIVLPGDEDHLLLQKRLNERVASWNLPSGWESRLKIHIEVAGFSSDRNKTRQVVKDTLSAFQLVPDGEPNLDQLYHQPDPDKAHIASQFKRWVDDLDWVKRGATDPQAIDIIEQGLKMIYGVD